jgi:hypothetical protein
MLGSPTYAAYSIGIFHWFTRLGRLFLSLLYASPGSVMGRSLVDVIDLLDRIAQTQTYMHNLKDARVAYEQARSKRRSFYTRLD